MKRFAFLLLLLAPSLSGAQSAPMTFIPPPKDAAALEALLHPFPQAVIQEYLKTAFPLHVFRVFEGMNDSLWKAGEQGGALQIGEGYPVDLDGADLFGPPINEHGVFTYLAQITSLDAYALRVEVDLSGLLEGDELWVVDTVLPRAFGPFGTSDQTDDSWWSPTAEGDSLVLMLRTSSSSPPPLRVSRISHFYVPLQEKQFPCPINVNCETDAEIQQAATAVGRLQITTTSGSTILCSGALIEAPRTPQKDPYFISAQHCFRTPINQGALEVIWDFRAASCNSTADPPLATFPRSQGGQILASDSFLDFAFLELNNVPVGALGRAYLGWNQTRPGVGTNMVGIHHPRGTSMKLAYGRVTKTNVSGVGRSNQNEINWLEGITEAGSSGSPALFRNGLAYSGALSNGTTHTCFQPERNFDNYSSFPDFYPQIACFLVNDAGCESGTGLNCAAKMAFGDTSEAVQRLREFRDGTLGKHAWGKPLIAAYYEHSPALSEAATRSEEARNLFKALLYPVVLYQRLIAQTP